MLVKDFINYTVKKMRKADSLGAGSSVGKEPHYPMAVFFVGEEAARKRAVFLEELWKVWPSYREEILFFGAERERGENRLVQFLAGGTKEPLSERSLQARITSLFSATSPFRDKNNLMIYYVLDTGEWVHENTFFDCLSLMESCAALSKSISPVLEMMFVLMDETDTRNRIPDLIKDFLGKQVYEEKNHVFLKENSMYLLSNRCDDGSISPMEMLYRVASSVLLLSNNSDSMVVRNLFSREDIKTAGFSGVQKPCEEIAKILVEALLQELQSFHTKNTVKLRSLPEEEQLEKLGISKNLTFRILDDYARREIFPTLAGEEELSLFPRYTPRDIGDLSLLSSKDFNEFTMGAWFDYLLEKREEVRGKIGGSTGLRERLQKEYREFLLSGCSREDLLYVYENLFSIREKMGLLQEPKHDQYVLFEGREQILYLLSSDPSLKNPLLDTLKEEGKRAREMLAEWNTIYSSRREVHEVRDENMSDFYRFRFRNHLDSDFRQRALEQDFLRANTSEALEAVITGALGEMIQRDEIFRASFEEELAQRFGYRKLEIDIGAYVRKSLTVENMHIYFRSLFDLGDPVFSAISLKTGSRLHESLRENIGSDTYYYNTGISTEISTVKIYLLHLSNLIRSKE